MLLLISSPIQHSYRTEQNNNKIVRFSRPNDFIIKHGLPSYILTPLGQFKTIWSDRTAAHWLWFGATIGWQHSINHYALWIVLYIDLFIISTMQRFFFLSKCVKYCFRIWKYIRWKDICFIWPKYIYIAFSRQTGARLNHSGIVCHWKYVTL